MNLRIITNTESYYLCFWICNIRGGILKPSKHFGLFDLWINDNHIIDSGQRGSVNIPARFPTDAIEYIGWIYGNLEDEKILKKIGVRGRMKWKKSDNSKGGIFEHCKITMNVAKELKSKYSSFAPTTFTGIDKYGRQTIYQPLWKGNYI